MLSRCVHRVAPLQSRPRLAWPRTRYLQAAASQQALLEPLDSHPGISCLSLNRPQSKNAISTTLLQVNCLLHVHLQVLIRVIMSYSNSEKASKSFISTRGERYLTPVQYTPSDIDH